MEGIKGTGVRGEASRHTAGRGIYTKERSKRVWRRFLVRVRVRVRRPSRRSAGCRRPLVIRVWQPSSAVLESVKHTKRPCPSVLVWIGSRIGG